MSSLQKCNCKQPKIEKKLAFSSGKEGQVTAYFEVKCSKCGKDLTDKKK